MKTQQNLKLTCTLSKLTGKAMVEAKLQSVRVCEEPAPTTNTPEKVAGLWHQYVTDSSWFEAGREQLVVFTMDTRHRCTGYFLISVGTINESLAHPREILRPVIMSGAYGFVLLHNHPSGDSTPSEADRALTRRIREAADLLQIHLLDHVIMGEVAPERGQVTGYFSFKEHGLI